MQITIRDNSAAVFHDLEGWTARVLEKCGMEGERKAADIIRGAGRVDTGAMINSVTHTVAGNTVYIGSNNGYMPYHEFGTGKFASDGNGRPGWWVYVPNSGDEHRSTQRKIYTFEEARRIVAIMRSQGIDAYMTQGIRPIHALRDAVANNRDAYERIIRETE